jgi:hypothetical protein
VKRLALVRLLENRIATLNGQRATAEVTGDISRVVELDEELADAQQTLEALRSLP